MSSSSAAGSDLTGRRPAIKKVLSQKKSNIGLGIESAFEVISGSGDRLEDETALGGAGGEAAARDSSVVEAMSAAAAAAAATAAAAEVSSRWSSMASTDG
jgi:hypothetical protein